MRSTSIHDSWCDEYSVHAELIEAEGEKPEVCVTVTWTGRGNFDGDGVGWIKLDELLSAEINQPIVVKVRTKKGHVGTAALPYRMVDKALSLLGYEEL